VAQTNPSGLDNTRASADLEAFADLSEPMQDRLLRTAHRTVKKLAPGPVPVDEDYRETARDGETAVLDFMLTTQGGILKSSALSGVSTDSYAGLDAVQRIVGHTMGGYYVGEGAAPSNGGAPEASVFNVSDEPLF
jgi:hypothetical protein